MRYTGKKALASASAFVTAVGLGVVTAPTASADTLPGQVSGAIQTSDVTGTAVNQNQYAAKPDVYLDGGPNNPSAHFLESGTYFFAVLAPGSQSDPNDGAAGNLSFGTAADRTFTTTGNGLVAATPTSTHAFSPAGGVQLYDFADTPNPGGVYIVAVCQFVADQSGAALPVDPRDCKYDAFKITGDVVVEQGVPWGEKSAVPTHTRTVDWTIGKTVAPSGPFYSLVPVAVNYSVVATKVASDTYGVTGAITVYNPTDAPIDVTVTEDGLLPGVGSCALDASGSLTVDAADAVSHDPGSKSVAYTCTFSTAPSSDTWYTNTATLTFGAQVSGIASDPFQFPAATLTIGSDPETVTVTDTFNAGAATALLFANAIESPAGTWTWASTKTLFNSNCAQYTNVATIVETAETARTTVTFCGPNNGGLTMGWWQNSNGQALLKNVANTSVACSTVNGYLGATLGIVNASTATTGSWNSAACATVSIAPKSPYLPTFTYNAIKAANASGTGQPMLEGQWLTTALDTSAYGWWTGAGKPTLNKLQGIKIDATITVPLGLAAATTCDQVGDLLSRAASQFASYGGNKSSVTALLSLFDRINNNKQQTC